MSVMVPSFSSMFVAPFQSIPASIFVRDWDFTIGVLPGEITFTRSTVGTFFDSDGVLQTAAINEPRFTHSFDGFNWIAVGLLNERAATNILFNSLTPATQTRTISNATEYTISLVGSGSLVLTDGLVGTVTDGSPVTATSTSTACTFTLSGSADGIQCETGPYATSIMPTSGGSAARGADIAKITGTSFSRWYNVPEGTFVVEFNNATPAGINAARIIEATDGTDSIDMYLLQSDLKLRGFVKDTTTQMDTGNTVATLGDDHTAALAYKFNDCAVALDGAITGTDTSVTIPSTLDELAIGHSIRVGGRIYGGTIKRISYSSNRLSDTQLEQLTA